ncbi:unnamed protein product [Soboliphyme baturini]|uniref:CNH domain-containing protein n=1 Tax=Soboliphyme baturini TaxID=241478 RepID=A0A183J0K6_9BILA|nr:unnamed protein product [Soboliphyme baturini]
MAVLLQNEYLFGYQNLGVFVNAEGTAERAPIYLDEEGVRTFASVSSHIICITQKHLLIYSLSDQKQKQIIPFSFGHALFIYGHRPIISSRHQVYELKPISWEDQVTELLEDKNADEALKVALNAQSGIDNICKHAEKVILIKQRVAFLYLECHRWSDASNLLIVTQVDPREVISLCPDLLPTVTTFVKASPPLHNIPFLSFITKDDAKIEAEFDQFLMNYLVVVRKRSYGKKFLRELDTASLKLLSKHDCISLEKFLYEERYFDVENCILWCLNKKAYHAAALISWKEKNYDKAFSLWKKIIDGHIADAQFNCLQQIYPVLLKCPDFSFLVKNSNWFLHQDPDMFLKLVIESQSTKSVNLDSVISLLAPDPDVLLKFLEHVSQQRFQDEKVLMRIAEVFVKRIALSEESESAEEVLNLRQRYRKFLLSSTYNTDSVLQTMNDCSVKLSYEKAIVLARMKKYQEALENVIETDGCDAAEEFCAAFCQESKSAKENLQVTLLKLYLTQKMDVTSATSRALRILNTLETDTCFDKVLELLPDYWSVVTMKRLILSSMHMLQTKSVRSLQVQNLTRRINVDHCSARMRLREKLIRLSDLR